MTFSAMPTGDPRQSEIEMSNLNPTDADLGLSPPTDSSATQPCCTIGRLWAVLWSIASWPWTILWRIGLCLWFALRAVASMLWTALKSLACGLWRMLCYIKRWLVIIVLDIILGVVDIGSDIISGTLFLNGGESSYSGNNSHC